MKRRDFRDSAFEPDPATGLIVPKRRIERVHSREREVVGAPFFAGGSTCDPFWAQTIFLYNNSLTAIDTGPNAYPLTVSAGGSINTSTPFVAGKGALFWDGVTAGGAFATTSNQAPLDVTGNVFTIEWVLKPSSIPATSRFVADKYDSGGAGNGWFAFVIATTGLFNFATRNAFVNQVSLVSTTAMSTVAYQHVACTVNGLTANGSKLWYNGALQHTQTAIGPNIATTQVMRMLTEPASSGGLGMPGSVAAMRITTAIRYTGAFTPPAGLFNSGAC